MALNRMRFYGDVMVGPMDVWAPGRHVKDSWLPGLVIGGSAMVVAPLVWLGAVTIRFMARELANFTPAQLAYFDGQTFRAPQQLAIYEQNPALTTAGYALFALASVLLVPAIVTLATRTAPGSPLLAAIGGTLATTSLLARLYFSGVDLTAFELVDSMGRQAATQFVLESYVDLSYGLWYVPVTVSAGSIVGSVLLAVAGVRAQTFGPARAVLFVCWGWTFMGVLKDSNWGTLVGGLALCAVLLPIGIQLLRETAAFRHHESAAG